MPKKKNTKRKASNIPPPAPKEAEPKKLSDDDVFREWFVGPEQEVIRKFISGQRRINGRFYKTLDLIGNALKKGPGSYEYKTCIQQACDLNEEIPGDPPGCNDDAVGGGGH